ncbi:putative nucleotidyltransferase component of viral defense system [Crossiella equi]|uniref:Nucleotidyltransferase component of viral defense system n=1 Tax=Crossiella equi TaxID=130796 RepID=A0ABS5AI98_9PSEU|nr:nucleotidyl transferase AbiEii/AbiGii toxin family protein [Crossiella equi]MBP2476298.1 putative nucleotidyltransferase component of viral defense system [Crossiella equi]
MSTNPAALRARLDARLKTDSADRAIDVNRLRRQLAFERILVRLGEDWVLKGGLALEFRLRNQCRATRDLDLALLGQAEDGERVREHLIDAFAEDPQDDHFSFVVGPPQMLAADSAGRPGWRFSVEARLAGRSFVHVRVDVVARAEEIADGVERLTLPSGLGFAGYPPAISVLAIDVHQHAAEKVHALTRDYGDRPNTRTKDLVDLVLLIEHELLDPARLGRRLRTVFDVRGTHDLPRHPPTPPAAWAADYLALTADLDVTAHTVEAAHELVSRCWADWVPAG